MPFIISVMVVSFVLLQLRLCQQFCKPLFLGVQNLAVRSGYRLKPSIKHPGLGAIKFLSEKANKGFSLEILQKRKKHVHGFKIQSSAGRSQNLFYAETNKTRRMSCGKWRVLVSWGGQTQTILLSNSALCTSNCQTNTAQHLSDICRTWKFNEYTFLHVT